MLGDIRGCTVSDFSVFGSVRFSNFGFGSVFRLKAGLGFRLVNVGFRLTVLYTKKSMK